MNSKGTQSEFDLYFGTKVGAECYINVNRILQVEYISSLGGLKLGTYFTFSTGIYCSIL